MHHQVRGADGDNDADNGGQPSHYHIMSVLSLLVDQRLVDVVGPHGREGADVARHAAHKSGNQRCDAQPQQSGAHVAHHHQRQHLVVTVQSRIGSAVDNFLLRFRREIVLDPSAAEQAAGFSGVPANPQRTRPPRPRPQAASAAIRVLQQHQAQAGRAESR